MRKITNIAIHHAGGLGNDNFASTINLSLKQIDLGHQSRWPDFPSKIKDPVTGRPLFVGYNFVILKDGTIIQTRPLGAETAAQIGHNSDTISTCVIGNFMKKANGQPVDVMTEGQISSLKLLLNQLTAPSWKGFNFIIEPGCTFDLTVQRIYPHRVLQPKHTDCNGTFYPDDWGRRLAMVQIPTPSPVAPVEPQKPLATKEDVEMLLTSFEQIKLLWMKINDIFAKKRFGKQQLGASPNDRGCDGFI